MSYVYRLTILYRRAGRICTVFRDYECREKARQAVALFLGKSEVFSVSTRYGLDGCGWTIAEL